MSYTRGKPLRPMPKSKRPPLMWSRVAASSAMRSGLLSGRTCTAVPTRSRRVRVAMAQPTAIGADNTERAGEKCISPSHATSSPHASAASARRKPSSNAALWVPVRTSNPMKMPKSIRFLPSSSARRGRSRRSAAHLTARPLERQGAARRRRGPRRPSAACPARLDGRSLWADPRRVEAAAPARRQIEGIREGRGMLSREDNERVTRVGPGTPMGRLLRRYWIPALLGWEPPEPDCPPVRVKLLGEELVAFRDTSGGIGLLDERCPHRRVSLYFGRNEECGLRCVYHGWKFDVD